MPIKNTKLEERLLAWIKALKEGNRVIPHDSYDAGCCEGDNDSLRYALIAKLESLMND